MVALARSSWETSATFVDWLRAASPSTTPATPTAPLTPAMQQLLREALVDFDEHELEEHHEQRVAEPHLAGGADGADQLRSAATPTRPTIHPVHANDGAGHADERMPDGMPMDPRPSSVESSARCSINREGNDEMRDEKGCACAVYRAAPSENEMRDEKGCACAVHWAAPSEKPSGDRSGCAAAGSHIPPRRANRDGDAPGRGPGDARASSTRSEVDPRPPAGRPVDAVAEVVMGCGEGGSRRREHNRGHARTVRRRVGVERRRQGLEEVWALARKQGGARRRGRARPDRRRAAANRRRQVAKEQGEQLERELDELTTVELAARVAEAAAAQGEPETKKRWDLTTKELDELSADELAVKVAEAAAAQGRRCRSRGGRRRKSRGSRMREPVADEGSSSVAMEKGECVLCRDTEPSFYAEWLRWCLHQGMSCTCRT